MTQWLVSGTSSISIVAGSPKWPRGVGSLVQGLEFIAGQERSVEKISEVARSVRLGSGRWSEYRCRWRRGLFGGGGGGGGESFAKSRPGPESLPPPTEILRSLH